MADGYQLQAAKVHERDRSIELRNQRLKRTDEAKLALEHSLAARGYRQSGQYAAGLLKIQQREMERYIDEAVELRRTLLQECEGLASEYEITALRKQLSSEIDTLFQAMLRSIARRDRGSGNVAGLEFAKQGLKGRLGLRLNAVKREAAFRRTIPKTMPSHTTIHADHGAVVNAGTITNSSISTNSHINDTADLTCSIATLADAIRVSETLEVADKNSILETLEFISHQVSEPAEKRQKAGVIQAAWNGLRPVLSACSNVLQLYSAMAPVVEGFVKSL
jgi:hypothetical protein